MTDSKDGYIDQLILAEVTVRWQKVAMIIAKTLRKSESRHPDIEDVGVAVRIRALCDEGRLESQGDLSKWRHSEVRLAGRAST